MSAWLMGAELATGAAGALSQYFADKQQAKYMEQLQAFNNKVVNLSNANNINSITEQSIQVRDQSARDALTIQMGRLQASAQAEVSAAAAGVEGNSVALSMLQIGRNASRAEHLRQESLKSHYISVDASKRNSQFSAFTQQDRNYIPQPQAISSALGFVGSAYKTVEKYYPDMGQMTINDLIG